MNDQNRNDRQDPAEAKRTDQATPTEKQAGGTSANPPSSVDVKPSQPENDKAVTVTPSEPEGEVVIRGGAEYAVTPEHGHRKL